MVLSVVSLIFVDDETIIGIKCSKGRGIILPGGLLESGDDSFHHGAVRELREETGLIRLPRELKWMYTGPSCYGSDHICHGFLGSANGHECLHLNGDGGEVVMTTWGELFKSQFKGYYRILHDILGD